MRTGDISKEMGVFYSTLFDKRMESDYDDFVTFEAGQVEQWIERAEQFVDTVAERVHSDR